MTEQVDELIAEFRSEGNEWGGKYSALFFKAADALESTLAELRQERERRIPVALQDVMDARAALSRAEEAIEKFEGLRLKLNADADYRVTKAWAGHQIHAILTDYDKQKGQADG